MTHEAIVHGSMLTLRGPGWEQTLSQGQCAAIVCVAEMHNKQPAQPSGSFCSICGGTQEECQHRRCYGYVNGHRAPLFKADQPSGDDAAEAEFAGFLSTHALLAHFHPEQVLPLARHILHAIDRGQFKFLHSGPENSTGKLMEYLNEITALRARLAEADDARMKWRDKAQDMEAERDKALADLAAVANDRSHILGQLKAAERDLATARGQVDEENRRGVQALMDVSKIKTMLAAANERAEKAEAFAMEADAPPLLTELLTVLGTVVGDHGDSEGAADCARRIIRERDAAKAEVVALSEEMALVKIDALRLKERTVTLPLMFGEPDKGIPADVAHGWKMYDDAIEECTKAIRAAGVKVVES